MTRNPEEPQDPVDGAAPAPEQRPVPEITEYDAAALSYYLDQIKTALPPISERVMIFIDWGYVVAGVRDHQEKGAVDIQKLASKLVGTRRLIRTYIYDGKIETTSSEYWRGRKDNQQKFASAIAFAPMVEMRWGRLAGNPPRQKGVDVLLSLDMLRFALKDNYDTAILVSGDGDYADIVKMVKDEGRKVEVMTIPGSRSFSLVEAADLWAELDTEYLADCRMEVRREE